MAETAEVLLPRYILLMVPIPGSLEKIGIAFKVADSTKNSYLKQQDLGGQEFRLDSNWASMDL